MQPTLDVVIIGLNSAKTLDACLASIRASDYPSHLVSIYYADGGSRDNSFDLATAHGARVLVVEAQTPTPGRQRNAGWHAGTGELVQFLDSDTVLDPHWLTQGAAALTEGVGAVCGDRKEMRPEDSVFNWIGDQEWNPPAGESQAFGGDVLIRRSVLAATEGYDPDLIAGEDPELSYRVRAAGWKILKLAAPMTRHDLAMKTLKQYWKRAYRTGHAYAEVQARHPDFWKSEVRRIGLRGMSLFVVPVFLLGSFFSVWTLVPAALGLLFFLRPRLMGVGRFQASLAISRPQARTYAWHATLVVVPQFFGMVRFYLGRLFSRPLTNKVVLRNHGEPKKN